ncbi:MAG TPA: F0F1 ATP synthase subunit B [Vitreimonas sp.]|nr:F0F1 ATP synthase subunit B [Vitreimonas sp.]
MEIQLPQILFQIINFFVVFGALSYLLYKPVKKILEERANRIEEGQLAAQKSLAEQHKIEELRKQAEKEAKKQAAEILEQAKKDATKQTEELASKAQEHAKAQLLKFQTEWQEQKKELVKELKQQFTESVVAAAEKVVGASLDKKAHAKLIDDELNTLLKSL